MKIFLTQNSSHDTHYLNLGFTVSYDENEQSDFCGPIYENNLEETKNYCSKYNITNFNFDLLDKHKLVEICDQLNIPTLPMVLFDSPSVLEQFNDTPFILKPSIGLGASPSIDGMAYKKFNTVSDCLDIIKYIPNFFNDKKYYVQKSVVNKDENELLIIVSGFINGKQEIIFSNISEEFQINIRPSETRLPIDDNDVVLLKQYTTDLLIHANVRNTPFMWQFVRRLNEPFYAIDFQYRLDYVYLIAGPLYSQDHCTNLLKFTYDMIPFFETTIGGYLKQIENVDLNNTGLYKLCDELKVSPLRPDILEYNRSLENIEETKKTIMANSVGNVIFLTASSTTLAAKENMYEFERRLKLL